MAATEVQPGALMPDAGIIKLSAFCYLPPQLGVNSVYYRFAKTLGTPIRCSEVAKALSDTVSPHYADLICVDATFIGVKAQLIDIVPTPLAGIASDSVASVWTDHMLPTQTAAVITWTTGVSGPRGRGRIYVPFPGTDKIEFDGSPTVAYLADMTALRAAWLAFNVVVGTVGSYSFTPVIYHRATDVLPSSTSDILGSRNNDKFGTQRRRGAYGRVNSGSIT